MAVEVKEEAGKKHSVYVYGTLRPGDGEPHVIPGQIFDLGWFPGLKMLSPDKGEFVVAERVEVSDDQLTSLDSYEGYYPSDPRNSLYIRVPYLDGWTYIYNKPLASETHKLIPGGDWLTYRNELHGSNANAIRL